MQKFRDCCGPMPQVQFIPEKWQQNIGESCITCREKLQAQDCISMCKCYLFCHEFCFLREFSPYLSVRQEIRCIRCQEQVKVFLKFVYKWECDKRPLKIIGTVFAFVVLLVMFILTGVGIYRSAFSDAAGYVLFSVLAALLIFSVVFSLRKKYIYMPGVRVHNTNLLNRSNSQQANPDKQADYRNDLKNNSQSQDIAMSSDKDFAIQ